MRHKHRWLLAVLGLWLTALAALWAVAGGDGQSRVQAQAATGTIRVATTGDDAPGCGGGTNPCRTVQYAVDRALPGEEIHIAGGVYTGLNTYGGLAQVVYLSRTVTLRGGYDPPDWTHPGPDATPTLLDAEGQGRVIYITGTITVTLEGLHFTGGDATGLGGGSVAGDAGGGVYIHGAAATIHDCQVYSNTAGSAPWGTGGGLYLRGSSATLRGNTIVSNTASTGSGGFGGGLYLDKSPVTLIDNSVQGNIACTQDEGFGGGLYLILCDAELRANTIEGNTASIAGPGDGGGLYLYRSNALLEGNIIQGNTSSTGGAGRGGGLHTCTSTANLRYNTISGNRASTISTGSGGGLFSCTTNSTLFGNTVVNNTASTVAEGYGGGLCFSFYATTQGGVRETSTAPATVPHAHEERERPATLNATSITLTNNLVAGNRASSQGGGLWLGSEDRGTSPFEGKLLHNTIADNGDSSSGQGLYARAGVHLTFTNTIITGHAGEGIVAGVGSTMTLEATLWHDNGVDTAGAGLIVTGTTNFSGDPKFVDPASGDYHLGAGSAALDRGPDTGIGTDIDAQPRPYRAPDLGADEYWPPGVLKPIYLPFIQRATPQAGNRPFILHGNEIKCPICASDRIFTVFRNLLGFSASSLCKRSPGSACVSFVCPVPEKGKTLRSINVPPDRPELGDPGYFWIGKEEEHKS